MYDSKLIINTSPYPTAFEEILMCIMFESVQLKYIIFGCLIRVSVVVRFQDAPIVFY